MAIYKSAQGKAIDMSILATKNEKTRAVSNMNLNARGDVIDSNNRVIQENNKRVGSQYNNTVNNDQAPATPESDSFFSNAQLIADEPIELTEEEKQFEEEDASEIKQIEVIKKKQK
jgi:hypothetical protein